MIYDDAHLARFREQWWHLGRCWRCWTRYSDWFVTRKGERYCWPCSQDTPDAEGGA